jgi:hypothetical protein
MTKSNLESSIEETRKYIDQAPIYRLQEFCLKSKGLLHFTPSIEQFKVQESIENLEFAAFTGDPDAAAAIRKIALIATQALQRVYYILQNPEIPGSIDAPEVEFDIKALEKLASKLAKAGTSDLSKTRVGEQQQGQGPNFNISREIFPRSASLTESEFKATEIVSGMIQRRFDIDRLSDLNDLSGNSDHWPEIHWRTLLGRVRFETAPIPSNLGKGLGIEPRGTPSSSSADSRRNFAYYVLMNLKNFQTENKKLTDFQLAQFRADTNKIEPVLLTRSKAKKKDSPVPCITNYERSCLESRWKLKAFDLPIFSVETISVWSSAALSWVECICWDDYQSINWPSYLANRKQTKVGAGTVRDFFLVEFKALAGGVRTMAEKAIKNPKLITGAMVNNLVDDFASENGIFENKQALKDCVIETMDK